MSVTGALITLSDSVLYPSTRRHEVGGYRRSTIQQIGGLVMWVLGGLMLWIVLPVIWFRYSVGMRAPMRAQVRKSLWARE